MGKVILGAIVGIGAIAAAPFTGGGSLLGVTSLTATLSASLNGIGPGLVSVAGGIVGAAVADGLKAEPEEDPCTKDDG